jgi:hypothetical protein
MSVIEMVQFSKFSRHALSLPRPARPVNQQSPQELLQFSSRTSTPPMPCTAWRELTIGSALGTRRYQNYFGAGAGVLPLGAAMLWSRIFTSAAALILSK